MSRKKLIVLSNAVEGREADFNQWYTNRHLADVLKVPGFVAAQRFEIQGDPVQGARWRYFALYDVEHDNPDEAIAELTSRVGTAAMPMSDSMSEAMICALYSPITDRVIA